MQYLPHVSVALLLITCTTCCAQEVTLGPLTLTARPVVSDDFAALSDRWSTVGDVHARGGTLFVGAGAGTLAEAWLVEPLQGAHLIRFRMRVGEYGEGARVALLSCSAQPSTGPEGVPAFGAYETRLIDGTDDDGLRLVYHPDGVVAAESDAVSIRSGREYELALLKIGIRYYLFVDGVWVLDLWDHGEPGGDGGLTGGYTGIVARNASVEISDFRVDESRNLRWSEVTRLRDLSLRTDLSQARIVRGPASSHDRAAASIADAVERVTGTRPDILTATDAGEVLPNDGPLICIGNLADNPVIRRLYFEFHTLVDRRFPGSDGYLLQTIHDPYGTGHTIVIVGASDDDGLRAATEAFEEVLPADGILGRLYDLKPAPEYAAVGEFAYGSGRLIIPSGWPHHFALANYGSRDDPRHTATMYLLTGDDTHAEKYREQMLRWIEQGIQGHLYVPGWMELWDLIEEHPVFSNEERLRITNWFLTQVRSQECIGALHIQRYGWGMPHQNHGTRPGIGTFYMARYFRTHYKLPEMDVYLERVARYFDMQADWSKPMCDSCMHQWQATLENKANYALASGNERFFSSGAARRAAERALVTTDNSGYMPTFGDGQWGSNANSLLTKAALWYGDGRYLWPASVRPDQPRADTDEPLRGFSGDVRPVAPHDLVGTTVVPYDEGFWHGWRNLPRVETFTPPNIAHERAFDKIAFRTGLDRNDEFLLLDGMLGASHDYDDTNTIHAYSKNGRDYIVTYDGLPSSTMAWHNGVNIIRDGISSRLPSAAELIHSAALGETLVSQTRLNDFAWADWTRTIVLVPEMFVAVIDRVQAREEGTFSLTGRWKTLGEPTFSSDTLTVSQWPRDEQPGDGNATHFHLQAAGHTTTHRRLEYRHGLGAREYPFAAPLPSMLAHAKTSHLAAGGSEYLYMLGHETGDVVDGRFAFHEVAEGVMRVTDGEIGAFVGAPAQAVEFGPVCVDADVFVLNADMLAAVGGRSVSIGGTAVLDAASPVTGSIDLRTGELTPTASAETRPLDDAALAALKAALASTAHDRGPAGAGAGVSVAPGLELLWEYDAGGAVNYLRAWVGNPGADVRPAEKQALPDGYGIVGIPSHAGHVSFVDAAGAEVRRFDVGVRINDVVVDDINGDGGYETLLARHDCQLQCLDAEGQERFVFAPEREQAVNSTLMLPQNSALYVFTARTAPDLPPTICVTTGDQRLHGLDSSGERQWLFWSYAGFFGIHGLYDLEGDGVREIVGGNPEISSGDPVFFLSGENTFKRRILNDGWGSTLSSMAIGDINGNGRQEIVIGTGRANLHAIDPAQDGYLWSHALGDDVRGCEIVTAGPDGAPLVVAGGYGGFVLAFDGAGEKQWATPMNAPIKFMTSATRAGSPVIVVALMDGAVVTLDHAGAVTGRVETGVEPTALTVAGVEQATAVVAGTDNTVRALALQ